MPITSIRVQNFKCFRDSGPVKVAPVTMIFVRNNAGKSTLLQSLLLLRQTLDSGGFGASLNLRGPLFSAGSYVDLVHNPDTGDKLKHFVTDLKSFGITNTSEGQSVQVLLVPGGPARITCGVC